LDNNNVLTPVLNSLEEQKVERMNAFFGLQVGLFESNPEMHETIRHFLEKEGARVHSLRKPESKMDVEVLLLDMDSDFELLQSAFPNLQTALKILTTRLGPEDGRRLAMELGADDVLHKPVIPAEWKFRFSLYSQLLRERRQRQALETELNSLAITDEVTSLLNDRGWNSLIDREWKRALRKHEPLSMLRIQIDDFPSFKKENSKEAVLQCLQILSKALQDVFQRPGDRIARCQNEFRVLLADTRIRDAMRLAEKARARIAGEHIPHSHRNRGVLEVSIGCMCSDEAHTLEEWNLKTDEALRHAMVKGNTVSIGPDRNHPSLDMRDF
jgi:diguanylate cyclase (GGDEF)-like protein